ncbi:MAG: AAA family ATPase [Owenweeksia sp.]
MHLANIKIWNFRKIGTSDDDSEIKVDNPGIDLNFNPNLNVIIGENDSGKTAIIDAIRSILGTQSREYQYFDERDFYRKNKEDTRTRQLRIECLFRGFSDQEAGHFLEWIHFNDAGEYELRVWLQAYQRDNRVLFNTKAGKDENGVQLDGNARDLLRATYLKPLRDAESELSPGYKSRLAQILKSNPIFKDQFDKGKDKEKHVLEKYIKKANDRVEGYFNEDSLKEDAEHDIKEGTPGGGKISKKVSEHLEKFFHTHETPDPVFKISGDELGSVLRSLALSLEDNKSGLGSLNLLFIAAELLLLQGENHQGLRLALIEELEAHLHPQAQLRVISALQETQKDLKSQFILSTHSTTLASKLDLDNLILCFQGQAYPMKKGETGLEDEDYEFLERFLDDTKSNLFFAKGVLLVEGDAENLLLPALAEIIGKPLHKHGVSIVNVGSKALLRYAKIFKRKEKGTLPIKVAVVTDLDIALYSDQGVIKSKIRKQGGEKAVPSPNAEQKKLETTFDSDNGNIKVFSSSLWTMEHDLASGDLSKFIYKAVRIAQLITGWSKKGEYKSPSSERIVKQIENADKQFQEWINNGFDSRRIAFEIYKPLDNKSASKAVTAQWLAKLLMDRHKEDMTATQPSNHDTMKHLLETDPQVRYLVNAINHVTTDQDHKNASNG